MALIYKKPKTKGAFNPLLADPTRTTTLRRVFSQALRGRLNILSQRVSHLIGEENALGIITHNFNPNHDELGRFSTAPKAITNIKDIVDVQAKAFEQFLKDKGHGGWTEEHSEKGFKKNWNKTLKGLEADPEDIAKIQNSIEIAYKDHDLPHVPIIVRKQTADEASRENAHWDNGFMVIDAKAHEENRYRQSVKSLDSDRKTTVKEAYPDLISGLIIHELGHKYHDDNPHTIPHARTLIGGTREELKNIASRISDYASSNPMELVAEAYAMKKHKSFETLPEQTKQLVHEVLSGGLSTNTRWVFKTASEQVKAFSEWFMQQAAELLYQQEENSWWREYVQKAYEQGAGATWAKWRDKTKFLQQAFNNPVQIERVKTLAGRVLTELKNVTQVMATQMSRSLVDGLAQGKSPREVAKDLTTTVSGLGENRASAIAQTETIRAHAEGQLDSLENLGMDQVGVQVEWSTSGLGKTRVTGSKKSGFHGGYPSPCKVCKPMKGAVFTIQEARGLIPRHVNCRCSWVPAGVGEDTGGQKIGKRPINDALKQSIKAEIPAASKTTLAQQMSRTKWVGADRIGKISGKKPGEISQNFNPNHDELGRFSTSSHPALQSIHAQFPSLKNLPPVTIEHLNSVSSKGMVGLAEPDSPLGAFYEHGNNKIGLSKSLPNYGEPKLKGETVGGDARTMFAHEYGHHVQDHHRKSIGVPIDSLGRRMSWQRLADQFVGKDKPTVVSEYAKTSHKELFAESFTFYTHPKYVKGSLPKEIEEYFEAAFGPRQLTANFNPNHDKEGRFASAPSGLLSDYNNLMDVAMVQAKPAEKPATMSIYESMSQIDSGADMGALVSMKDLRKHTGIPKEKFDKAVVELARSQLVMPHYHDFATSLSPEKLAELVDSGPDRHANAGRYWIGIAKRRG